MDHVHSDGRRPGQQPSETRGRHVSAAINCLTKCRGKSVVIVVAVIVSTAERIAAVLVGKHLIQTHDHNELRGKN